jgi:membrane associated rhomboid family serine protease
MFPLKDNIHKDHFPLVTVVLIAINVLVYLLAIRHGGSIINGPSQGVEDRFSLIPYALTHPGAHCRLLTARTFVGEVAEVNCGARGAQLAEGVTQSSLLPAGETVFTSMFMHADIEHIGFNMLFLGVFGPTIEDAMGHGRFIAFYLIGGLVALVAQVASNPGSSVPMLGASGAIAAVMGGYIVFYPRARILTLILIVFFFTLVELPAIAFLGVWFLLQIFEAELTSTSSGGGVANFAHIGGFVFGLALIGVFARHRKPVPPRYPVY